MKNKESCFFELDGINYVQLYFWAVPVGVKFYHKDGFYTKINSSDDNNVVDDKGKEWRFEGHHGCLIAQEDVFHLEIPKNGFRFDPIREDTEFRFLFHEDLLGKVSF